MRDKAYWLRWRVRLFAGLCAASLLFASCASREGEHPAGFRVLHPGTVVRYHVDLAQKRTASGLGPRKLLAAGVRLDVEEEDDTDHSYTLVVRAARAAGEDSQRVAANRIIGRRIAVDLRTREVVADAPAFSGSDDIAAADIAMLFLLFAPVLPSTRTKPGRTWRVVTRPAQIPWAVGGVTFTIDNEVTKKAKTHDLDARVVSSAALANLTFRVPLVVPAPATAPGGVRAGSQKLIVNQLFEALFSDIHNPVQGLAATIAAIPLSIVAPFIALGEAISNLFGNSKSREPSQPAAPVVNLSGPVRLVSSTTLWAHDGRVLGAAGTGGMTLSGQIPQLPGRAASLSGKTLHLDTTWTFSRTHTSPFPEPPPSRPLWPLVVAGVLAVVAAALTFSRVGSRGYRRTRGR